MGTLKPPEPLTNSHHLEQFKCGKSVLDKWLVNQALENEKRGASRTYVVCTDDVRVIGYFCLANGSIAKEVSTGKLGYRMPDPIPVILLGRLAVDQNFQGLAIGKGMLQDAFFRARKAAELSAARALLVHALDDQAKQFYQHHGFRQSPMDTHILMHSLY